MQNESFNYTLRTLVFPTLFGGGGGGLRYLGGGGGGGTQIFGGGLRYLGGGTQIFGGGEDSQFPPPPTVLIPGDPHMCTYYSRLFLPLTSP